MRFTREEFETMASQMLDQKPISYEMLAQIAEKTLRSTVKNWCSSDETLKGRGYEDDIMQEIHVRLIKTTIPYFLRRSGVSGPYNNDPEGFEDWLFRVAENLKKDFANNVRKIDFKTADMEDPLVENLPDRNNGDDDQNAERVEKLMQAFNIVLSSSVNIYKVLTWLAHCLFMFDNDATKIESNKLILAAFENKTLDEMYNMLLDASVSIPWLVITQTQDAKIRTALRKKRRDGVTYGETQYKAFFMKNKGEVSGKKSISDWMNRMNDIVRREMGEEEPDPMSEKDEQSPEKPGDEKTPEDDGGKKGRGGDEASNC